MRFIPRGSFYCDVSSIRSNSSRPPPCSIIIAVVVMALKYLAYRLTGSVALFSDALESIVNVITGAVALWATGWVASLPMHGIHLGIPKRNISRRLLRASSSWWPPS